MQLYKCLFKKKKPSTFYSWAQNLQKKPNKAFLVSAGFAPGSPTRDKRGTMGEGSLDQTACSFIVINTAFSWLLPPFRNSHKHGVGDNGNWPPGEDSDPSSLISIEPDRSSDKGELSHWHATSFRSPRWFLLVSFECFHRKCKLVSWVEAAH